MESLAEERGRENRENTVLSHSFPSLVPVRFQVYCSLLVAPSPLNLNTWNKLKLAQGYDQIKTIREPIVTLYSLD